MFREWSENDAREGIELIGALLVLSQRKATIVKITLAAIGLATIGSLLLPNMYTATTTICHPSRARRY